MFLRLLMLPVFLIAISLALPQKASAVQKDIYSIGLWAGAKASSNIEVLPRGRQAEPAFNMLPDFGLRAYLPVDDTYNIHVVPEIYFSSYYYTTKDAITGVSYTTELSGLIGGISLFMEGFELGIGYGTVVSADIPDVGIDDDVSMQDIINLTFGYRYTFYTDENGALSAFTRVEMLFNDVYSNYPEDDPLASVIEPDFQVELQEQHNPRLAALTIGIAWDFDASALFEDEKPVFRQR